MGQLVERMNKKAIVIGATSGIGREVALQLAEKGWLVGIAGRRTDLLREVQRQAPEGRIDCLRQIDITKDDASDLLQEMISEMGGMDLYFHSSGIGWQNTTLDIDKELQTVATNGMGFVRMVATAYRWMVGNHKKGHIACITSIAGTKGLGAAPAYSSTKRFQNHYIECLSQQARMRHLPILFTDIRPGFVKTDLIAGSHYPLQLDAHRVAKAIVDAIEREKAIKVIDWRYAILVFFWRLIPHWLWTRMKIG